MKHLFISGITGMALGALVLVSCAPAPPSAAPSPTPSIPRAVAPLPATLRELTPQENAWAKVVEAAKKEGKLNHYTYYFFGDIGLATAKAFRKRYGVDIEFVVGRGSEFNERIATEQRIRQYTGDVLDSSPAWNARVKERGFTLSLLDLPVLQDRGVWVISPIVDAPDSHIAAFAPNPIPLVINTNLVKPQDEPKSWYDLLDPRWKGKIGINDPVTSSGPDILISYMVNHKALDMDYFRRLGEQNLVFLLGGSKESVEQVARGAVAFSIVSSITTTTRFLIEGAPIKPVDLKEGRPILTQTITALRNAPHPNASKLFLNWLLSPEGQAVYTQATTIESLRKDVPSAMPKGWVPATIPIVETLQDVVDSAQGFKDQVAAKVLKRK